MNHTATAVGDDSSQRSVCDVLCPVCFPEHASYILITFAHLSRALALQICQPQHQASVQTEQALQYQQVE
jgi:hypothetical protein